MAGSKKLRRSIALALGALATIGASQACSDDGSTTATIPTPANDALRRQVLENLGSNVFPQSYQDFDAKSASLVEAIEAWSTEGTPASREGAREAWREAMASWQVAELYQVGPAGRMGEDAGGDNLRDPIYSWPLVNACRVDQEIVSKDYEDEEAFSSELANVRGLDALEYLLFTEGDQNACVADASINKSGEWAAIAVDDLEQRRATYALTLARDVRTHAGDLTARWSESGGFGVKLAGAGTSDSPYGSVQEALNAVSNAMFYIEKETKDMKLAVPAGLSDCASATCPDEVESPHARVSMQNVRANVEGFERVYLGGDGAGFDDLLIELGATSLDAQIKAKIGAAREAIDAVPGTMTEALESDPQSVVAVHSALRELGTLLKTQFVGTLDLELPQRAEGDND